MEMDISSQVTTYLIPARDCNIDKIINNQYVLGIIEISEKKIYRVVDSKIPYLHIKMKSFVEEAYFEIWTSNRVVNYEECGNIQYSTDGNYYFSAIKLKEDSLSLEVISEQIYNRIFQHIDKNGCENIFRIWNYVPRINEFMEGIERYKLFCYGRSEAYSNNFKGKECLKTYPSATVIGSLGDEISIYLLSTSHDIHKNIENIRQVPAYKYPKEYGIKSPNFARATYIKTDENCQRLYISGTASIIGHKTVYEEDVKKQCETVIENIKVLISQENLEKYGVLEEFSLQNIDCIKVYIRRVEDFEVIKDICSKEFSPNKYIIFLNADICRDNLLVEIEGMIQAVNKLPVLN